MVVIHKSHSKKDLLNIIQIFKFDIGNTDKLKKKDIVKRLQQYILLLDKIEPELEVYMFFDIIELKQFLCNCNPKKVLTIKEKNNVINICKKIKNYCYNKYELSVSLYDDYDEILKDAKYIEPYGDIPSVRKVCNLLNKDIYYNFNLSPKMSKQTIKELENKRLMKEIKNPVSLRIIRKHIILNFD